MAGRAAALRHAVLRHVLGHAEAAEEFAQARWESRFSPRPVVCASPPSILTRTEITAGLTFSTMSAKPTGALQLVRLLCEILRRARSDSSRFSPGASNQRSDAEAATVVARRTKRRAESTRGFCGGCWERGQRRSSGNSISFEDARVRAVSNDQDGGDEPYSVLSAGLNFGKVEKISCV